MKWNSKAANQPNVKGALDIYLLLFHFFFLHSKWGNFHSYGDRKPAQQKLRRLPLQMKPWSAKNLSLLKCLQKLIVIASKTQRQRVNNKLKLLPLNSHNVRFAPNWTFFVHSVLSATTQTDWLYNLESLPCILRKHLYLCVEKLNRFLFQ